MATSQDQQMWSPLGKPRREVCVAGARQGHRCGHSPGAELCQAHALASRSGRQSPGVLAELRVHVSV